MSCHIYIVPLHFEDIEKRKIFELMLNVILEGFFTSCCQHFQSCFSIVSTKNVSFLRCFN